MTSQTPDELRIALQKIESVLRMLVKQNADIACNMISHGAFLAQFTMGTEATISELKNAISETKASEFRRPDCDLSAVLMAMMKAANQTIAAERE